LIEVNGVGIGDGIDVWG